MKLLILLRKQQAPSSRLRILNCLEAWQAEGVQTTVIPLHSGLGCRLNAIRQAGLHDVVLIQKKTSFHTLELKWLKARNPRIIFDFDDSMMFLELAHHKQLMGKHFKYFIRTMDHCAAVVAGNRFLARFAEANCTNVQILPTPVNLEEYKLRDWEHESGELVVGWIGLSSNLHYLQELQPVFQRLSLRFPNLVLKIVSNDFIDFPNVRVKKENWSLEREAELLASFDVGLMPLKDDLWTWGKCGYKILQYFGAGVPAIASPVGINMEFIQSGRTGYLADSHEEWERALLKLLESKDHRMQCGLAGRKLVEEQYSQKLYSGKYLEIMRRLAC